MFCAVLPVRHALFHFPYLVELGGIYMSDRYQELLDLVGEAEEDFDKFYNNGVKAAGTRVRKVMQELKKKAQDIRVEVQDIKKNEL
jgi:hypothetical protein